MRVLVSGAAGFLGSHLCDRLIAAGCSVVGIDNLMTGRRENLAHLARHPRFTFVEHDVIQPFEGKFDRIFNLACPASPPYYQRDPVGTARICFIGTDNLLRLANQCGARFFQASTSEIYGDPELHPQEESYRGAVNAIGPRACYDEGKRIGETLCFDYHRQLGIDIKVARIFNTYGPRMNLGDGRVVSNFIVQALKGEDITVYGDGAQTRSFCFVDDLIEGFMLFMDSGPHIPGPLNLGNPVEFTIRELAEIVVDMTGSRSRLVFCPLPEDDPRQRQPNIDRARQLLGWQPKMELREGLTRTIAYLQDQIQKAA